MVVVAPFTADICFGCRSAAHDLGGAGTGTGVGIEGSPDIGASTAAAIGVLVNVGLPAVGVDGKLGGGVSMAIAVLIDEATDILPSGDCFGFSCLGIKPMTEGVRGSAGARLCATEGVEEGKTEEESGGSWVKSAFKGRAVVVEVIAFGSARLFTATFRRRRHRSGNGSPGAEYHGSLGGKVPGPWREMAASTGGLAV